MIVAIYMLYAFIQAVLIQKFLLRDSEPVVPILMMTVFAPLVVVGGVIILFVAFVEWIGKPYGGPRD